MPDGCVGALQPCAVSRVEPILNGALEEHARLSIASPSPSSHLCNSHWCAMGCDMAEVHLSWNATLIAGLFYVNASPSQRPLVTLRAASSARDAVEQVQMLMLPIIGRRLPLLQLRLGRRACQIGSRANGSTTRQRREIAKQTFQHPPVRS